MKFNLWLKKVDNLVFQSLNLRLNDLPDEDFRVHWGNKLTCVEMANKIIMDQYDFLNFMS